ncbi:hypothetical protein J5276_22680 [Agrobacterium sp. S7/73]|nr:hypothetical protein J5276_22680 [Agrobacterium sp. S7/73]
MTPGVRELCHHPQLPLYGLLLSRGGKLLFLLLLQKPLALAQNMQIGGIKFVISGLDNIEIGDVTDCCQFMHHVANSDIDARLRQVHNIFHRGAHAIRRAAHDVIQRQRLAEKSFAALDLVVEYTVANAIPHKINGFILIFAHQDTK